MCHDSCHDLQELLCYAMLCYAMLCYAMTPGTEFEISAARQPAAPNGLAKCVGVSDHRPPRAVASGSADESVPWREHVMLETKNAAHACVLAHKMAHAGTALTGLALTGYIARGFEVSRAPFTGTNDGAAERKPLCAPGSC
jgi:hypothetical protein